MLAPNASLRPAVTTLASEQAESGLLIDETEGLSEARKGRMAQQVSFRRNMGLFMAVMIGIGAAAWGYFGKHVSALTLSESAVLAGIISSPASCAPAGAAAIRRLLMVGTPNLGSMQPVLSHVRGEEMGLRKIPAEVVATISGAPQLMPHPALPWLLDTRGRLIAKDVFDMGTWRELRWSIFDPDVRARTIARKGGETGGLAVEYLCSALGSANPKLVETAASELEMLREEIEG